MSITKKLRFEVFKRDGFQCAYCGKTPPAVVLEIDHIEPRAKGGSDDINNLITACFDCNRGKSATPLDKIPSALADNLETLREKELQLTEYRKLIKKIGRRKTKDIEEISELFTEYFPKSELAEPFKRVSIGKFVESLQKHEIVRAMDLGCQKFPADPDRALRYFCGVCWHTIRGDRH